MKFNFSLVILLLVSACGQRGCSPGEKITVIYRGVESIDTKAAIVKDDERLGFVEQVLEDDDKIKRVIVLLRDASVVTDKDHFKTFRDDSGLTGFRIEPRGGEPLKPGDQIEADPTWSLREYYASITGSGDITLPSGTPLPYPKALTAERKSKAQQITVKFQQSISRELEISKKRELKVDGNLAQQYREVEQLIEGKAPAEAKRILDETGKPLLERLQAAAEDVKSRRDADSYRDYRNLINRLERAQNKTERALEKLAIEAKKPKKEHWVPPDFR